MEHIIDKRSSGRVLSLRGCVVTCTGLSPEERNEIQRRVTALEGIFSPHLTQDVTHLVADQVGSQKYRVAADMKLPIIQKGWLDRCMEPLDKQVSALDIIAEFKLPALKGCVVCATGVNMDERESIERLTTSMGGSYSPDLTKTVTHLIAKISFLIFILFEVGRKYEFAVKWGLKVVSTDWISECASLGVCANESNFPVPETLNEGDQSVTRGTLMSQCSSFKNICFYFGQDIDPNARQSLVNFVKSWEGDVVDYDKKVELYFVVNGQSLSPEDEKRLNSARQCRVIIINQLWLRECQRLNRVIPNSKFVIKELTPSQGSLQSKFNVFSDFTNIMNTLPTTNSSQRKNSVTIRANRKQSSSNLLMENLLNYSQKNTGLDNKSGQAFGFGNLNSNVESKEKQCIMHEPQPMDATSVNVSVIGDLFREKTFQAVGFDEKEIVYMQTQIARQGGMLHGDRTSSFNLTKETFIILRFDSMARYTPLTNEIVVTEKWLERCIDENKILDPSSCVLFRPLNIKVPIQGFQKMLIGLTGYTGVERTQIGYLAKYLGASFTEKFSRKNTHLLCPKDVNMESLKLQKAVEWQITVITADWLYACAASGSILESMSFMPENCGNGAEKKDTQAMHMGNVSSNSTVDVAIDCKRIIYLTGVKKEAPGGLLFKNTQEFSAHESEDDKASAQDAMTSNETVIRDEMELLVSSHCGRTTYQQDDPECTHVVDMQADPIESQSWIICRKLPVVSPLWIKQSLALKQLAPEKDYPRTLSMDLNKVEEDSASGPMEDSLVANVSSAEPLPPIDSLETSTVEQLLNHTKRLGKRRRRQENEAIFSRDSNDARSHASKDSEMMQAENGMLECGDAAQDDIIYDDPNEKLAKRRLLEVVQNNNNKRQKPDQNSDGSSTDANAIVHGIKGNPQACSLPVSTKTKRFMFSGLPSKNRQSMVNYILFITILYSLTLTYSLIHDLGGEIIESDVWDSRCTHIITDQPSKTEKFLAAVAAGAWVIQTEYIVRSHEKGAFLPEEEYELSDQLMIGKNEKEKDIWNSARRWRIAINGGHQKIGSFNGWKVMLFTDTAKLEGYARVLRAGGAIVCIPEPGLKDVENLQFYTHCFVEPNRLKKSPAARNDVNRIANHSIPVLDTKFISDYLQEDPPPTVNCQSYRLL